MRKVLVSLSGGKTSAYLLKTLLNQGVEVVPLFMNTGLEHPETYNFLAKIQNHWGVKIVCLEAKVRHGERKGCTYKVVPFNKLHKGTKIAEEVVKKYGLFGMGYLHCTREMKQNPFIFWKKDHHPDLEVAIGIRADEFDRMAANASSQKIIYPLVKQGVTKEDVNKFFKTQPFNLNIPDYLGNCVGCWKKSNNKLIKVAQQRRSDLLDLRKLEGIDKSRDMFRGRRRVADLLIDAELKQIEESDIGEGCEESCEVFGPDFDSRAELL